MSNLIPMYVAAGLPEYLKNKPNRLDDLSSGIGEYIPVALHDVSKILTNIDPNADLSRDEWVKAGMAVYDEFGELGRAPFEVWSRRSTSYVPDDFDAMWNSLNRGGGITIATLVKKALEAGWIPESKTPEEISQLEAEAKVRQTDNAVIAEDKAKQKAERQKLANEEAQRIVDNAKTAPDNHPYLVNKQVKPHGALVDANGVLIIPITGTQSPFIGKTQSLQRIYHNGDKRFTKGGKKSGGYYIIQNIEDAPLIICEGFATGASIAEHYAEDSTVIIAFDSGNLIHVAKALRKQFPNAEILIAGDNDSVHKDGSSRTDNPGIKAANKAAQEIDASVAIPEFADGEQGSDWNDRYLSDAKAGLSDEEIRSKFKTIETPKEQRAADLLAGLTANNAIEKRLKMEKDSKFIMKGIAVLGEWTVLYAAPNTGKTLLTLWLIAEQIKRGEINGQDVFYANCDDSFKGANIKLKLANKYGFKMLIPNENEFTVKKLVALINQMSADESANGKIIVLDTLKKFTDLMDKKISAEFGGICRNFIAAGGSLICLAHVNKRTVAGKPIYSGTSDITDDADCTFIMSRDGTSEQDVALQAAPKGLQVIKFENLKNRGPIEPELFFEYDNSLEHYEQMFDSVRLSNDDNAQRLAVKSKLLQQVEQHQSFIESCQCLLMANGEMTQQDLAAQVIQGLDIGLNKAKGLIKLFTGNDWSAGYRWSVRVGEKNTHYYSELTRNKNNLDW